MQESELLKHSGNDLIIVVQNEHLAIGFRFDATENELFEVGNLTNFAIFMSGDEKRLCQLVILA